MLMTDTVPEAIYKYLKKSLLTGKTITLLIEDSVVLELELYNTGIYLLNHEDIYFFLNR